ncbi:MAG: acetylxylan esterase [Planctomycetales bacterium]|nr:acetylxylan esterase [Planctomycetales bacterium]
MHRAALYSAVFRFVALILLALSVSQRSMAAPQSDDVSADARTPAYTGPWDIAQLYRVPEYRWGETTDRVTEVFYQGLLRDGQPTTVYGVVARPANATAPSPGVVLVHGGGGTAFTDWATLWAQRGYVAIAMDLRGQGPHGERLPHGAPDFDELFHEVNTDPTGDETNADTFWSYHAIADVVLAHSLLRSLAEVDAERTAITGVSWGGYTTSLVAGLDLRFKAAVPIYGCGNLGVDSAWKGDIDGLDEHSRALWIKWFDPISYLAQTRCPTLWVNGTNDFGYPLGAYRDSYRAAGYGIDDAPLVTLGVKVGRPHGHRVAWAVPEPYVFIDHVLRGGEPLPRLAPIERDRDHVTATYTSPVAVVEAGLHYTTDTGRWQDRTWHSVPATFDGDTVTATLPKEHAITVFLSVTDERGLYASSDHLTVNE